MILSLRFFSTPYLPLRTDGKVVYVTRTQNACQMYGDPYTGHGTKAVITGMGNHRLYVNGAL